MLHSNKLAKMKNSCILNERSGVLDVFLKAVHK